MKLEQKSFKNLVDFLGDLKTPKIHSEINWPLKPCATVVCTRPSRQKSAFSSVGPLYWDVGPWPSPARLGRPNMAQLGPTEPSLGQQLLQIANLSSFFSGRTGMCMMREEQNGSIELCYGTAISSTVTPCTLKCHRLCRLNIYTAKGQNGQSYIFDLCLFKHISPVANFGDPKSCILMAVGSFLSMQPRLPKTAQNFISVL